MRKIYINPPIEEALVEFRFIPGQEWDLTIPGKLHEHPDIKREYPGKPRTQKALRAAVDVGTSDTPFAVRETIARVQLVDDDARRILSLGSDVLSVNTLRPYDGWEQFRPRIDTALHAYYQVAKPQSVSRIGVRYINKVVLPSENIKLEGYFRYMLPDAPELPTRTDALLSRVEYVYDDAVKLLLTQATVEAPEGKSAFALDLDVIWEGKEPSLDAIMKRVDDLHKREGEAFEAIITDASRELFNHG